MKQLQGIVPATVSPFGADGAFDAQAMRRVVRHQIDAGVDGIYVCGGTGEGLLMTREERQQALKAVLDEADGQVAVIAHIGAFRIPETLELAKRASEAGADAIAALPPAYFYLPDEESQVQYYTAIAEVSDVPVMIYNIPQRTGISMTQELYARLLEADNIVGMKDSSGDIASLGHFMARWPESVIFEGEDTVLLSGLIAGASGGIGATYNIMPDLYVSLWKAFQAKDMDKAAAIQERANEIVRALVVVSLFGAVKQTMAWMGLECGEPRAPNRALTPDETARLRHSLESVSFFD